MRQAQREINNYERWKVYHRAWYFLDAYSWTENYALEHGRSPEEILLEREEGVARLRLIATLPEALIHVTPTQAHRVRAYVKDNFVDKGMCADFAIHDQGTGNSHAHIMLTVQKQVDSIDM